MPHPRRNLDLFLLAILLTAACFDGPTSVSVEAGSLGPFEQEFPQRNRPQGRPAGCPPGTTGASGVLPGSGALFLICVPPGWDPDFDDLVVYAPGYVPPQLDLAIRDDVVGGARVSEIIIGNGDAFATTSYRNNGLIVVDATHDLQRLVAKFREIYGPIGGQTFAVGVSEGGLIATLATERHSRLFDGTLAACAPIGDFERQLQYLDDFRLAFDFFFAEVLAQGGMVLGSPIDIPPAIVAAFGTATDPGPLADAIAAALLAHPVETNQLLEAADIPLRLGVDPPARVVEFVLRILAYNILGTAQVQKALVGQPYDNVAPTDYDRPIDGLDVPPFTADQPALSHLKAMYETSGRLKSPLVTLFNTGDPIVPSWHEEIYADKVAAAGATEFLVAQIPANRVGHCELTLQEVLGAFGTLVQAATEERTIASP